MDHQQQQYDSSSAASSGIMMTMGYDSGGVISVNSGNEGTGTNARCASPSGFFNFGSSGVGSYASAGGHQKTSFFSNSSQVFDFIIVYNYYFFVSSPNMKI